MSPCPGDDVLRAFDHDAVAEDEHRHEALACQVLDVPPPAGEIRQRCEAVTSSSVEAISEDAGLSTGAIYSNFKGKEDLFLRLYEERIEGAEES